jgi:hypothetical protein
MSLSDKVLTFVNSASFKHYLPWVAGAVFVLAIAVAGFGSCGAQTTVLPTPVDDNAPPAAHAMDAGTVDAATVH